MANRSLRFRYHLGSEISEARLREVWRLRVSMLQLKSSEEDDWAYFSAFARRSDTSLFVFADRRGTVRGFFTVSFMPADHCGHRGLLLFSKYFYFAKPYRGHYMTTLAPWILLPIALRRYGRRSLHFVTSTFPQSFVSLSRMSGNAHALKSPGISRWQKAALTQFAREFFGDDFDADAGVVRRQNVVDTPGLPLSQEAEQLHAHYERLNPEWQQGVTLPIIFSVNVRMARHVFARTARRAVPRAWRTPPAA